MLIYQSERNAVQVFGTFTVNVVSCEWHLWSGGKRQLILLLESSTASTYIGQLTAACYSAPGNLISPEFLHHHHPPQTRGMHIVHKHICRPNTYKKFFFNVTASIDLNRSICWKEICVTWRKRTVRKK